jgi:GNAT superfamily N-acetyltransferase
MSARHAAPPSSGSWPAGFPRHLVQDRLLADGRAVRIRPIAPSDRHRHFRFVSSLSLQSRYHRLMSARHLLPGELRRMVEVDYVSEMALVAVVASTGSGFREGQNDEQEIGVARYVRDDWQELNLPEDPSPPRRRPATGAEFAIVVADAWQRRGVGELLLRSLIDAAGAAGLTNLGGLTLATNVGMIRLARRLGFAVSHEPGDWTVRRISWRQPAAAYEVPEAPSAMGAMATQ